MLFASDTGKISRDVEACHSLYPRFYGNWCEDSNSWKQSYILGVFIIEVGMVPHYKYPYFKSSPDRIVLVPPWVFWHHCRKFWPLRIMQEDKCPLFGPYINRYSGKVTPKQAAAGEHLMKKWTYPHMVPPHYVPQLLDQNAIFGATVNLFTYDWQLNDLRPMVRVLGTDVYLVSASLCLAVFHNSVLNNVLYDVYNTYAKKVMTENNQHIPSYLGIDHLGTDPTLPLQRAKHAMKTCEIQMLPVNQVRFFISGTKPRVDEQELYASHAQNAGGSYTQTSLRGPSQRFTHETAFTCECCCPQNTDLYKQPMPWSIMRWVRRRVNDPNVGVRPWGWKPEWCWPPYMGIALEFYPHATHVGITLEDLGLM
jgi:hypothetical protein